MDYAHVTRHNFKRLSGSLLNLDIDISIDQVFSSIYSSSLTEILNHNEAKTLYKQKLILEKNFESLKPVKKQYNKKYIFNVTPPKYHKDKDCKFLSADFKNYLVPPEINVLGEEKIKEFQNYCESTKKQFEGKSDEIFWTHVGLHFKVQISPKSILYENSGIQNIEKMTIEELKEKIHELQKECLLSINDKNEEKSKIINRYKYAPNMQKTLDTISSEESKELVINFYQIKLSMINSLLELYQKTAKIDAYVLPVAILQSCGLQPCKACSS